MRQGGIRREEEALCVICLEAGLTTRQAQVLLLHGIDGLGYAEIARQLGVSKNAVRVAASRARQRIRSHAVYLAELDARRETLREFLAGLREERAGDG